MKNNLLIAVIFTLLGLFLLDCMGIAIKYLRDDYPAAVLSVYRNMFGMIPCFIILFLTSSWHQNGRKLVINQWRLGLVRGIFVCFASNLFIHIILLCSLCISCHYGAHWTNDCFTFMHPNFR